MSQGASGAVVSDPALRFARCEFKPIIRIPLAWQGLKSLKSTPQQGDLGLSGPPSGQGAGSGARTRDRRVPADLRADSLATVPPTLPHLDELNYKLSIFFPFT
ncbi:hypothetical protein PoB_004633000 [Plakobranchus ocellatus]|uniref:Uncharacterized protein n=1 Tax=Plakobranchus ocellatus TaxID=259542 RepID=A0AAV4BH20_9GAST|nr:hypothetical protein PoB_004633000 [Plakobranchus ocellatus]